MNRLVTIRILILTGLFITCLFKKTDAQKNSGNGDAAIIPLPVEYKAGTGVFIINGETEITCAETSIVPAAELLNFYIESVYGKKLTLTTSNAADKNIVLFKIDSATVTHAEGYQLNVSPQKIELTAHDAAGIIYGIQTLRQLWKKINSRSLNVDACYINDYPRFSYRGMALDVSRHMFPVSFIKKYIDLLALYKLNTFHWHLTDDQGWRIEIKKYPKLQSIAAWRNETIIGHKKNAPHKFDGKRYGGYYTQQQAKEIVQYAAQRNITVIPEIEMPGHAMAALAAYPSLGCTGGPYHTATFWGVFDDVYCAGNDSTFEFLQQVLDEVMAIFPSQKIHIGGDECPKTRWKVCPKCQRRMKELGLKNEHDLQAYFIQRIEKYVNSKGRKIIGWDEILEGGLAPNATVMSWRGEEGGIAAAKDRHEVIMTPESYFYFDYYQSLYLDEPLAAGGFTPLQKVYSYEPASGSLNDSIKRFIKGIEAQAWSEYFTEPAKAEYMIFPRLLALSEIAWTKPNLKNYPDFLKRLRLQNDLLHQLKVNHANNFDEINITSTIKEKGLTAVALQSSLPGGKIYYTLDGSKPDSKSLLYTCAFTIKNSCILKAALYRDEKQSGSILQQAFHFHKAIGAAITLTNKGEARFNVSPATLVNGIYASDKYNDMQWMGFAGKDLEAVIDLGNLQNIHSVTMNFLNYHWQKMWAPQLLTIYTSSNGQSYEKIYTSSNFKLNGINKTAAVFPGLKARYIKVVAVNKGIIPPGEYGAGGKVLLMVDEINIR
jgi:hexosaminidase